MASTNPPLKSIIFNTNHTTIISEQFKSCYEKHEFADIVLITGSNSASIQAHRVVLLALSGYFSEKFRGSQTASKGNIIELKEIEATTLKPIIDFMYSGSIELNIETVRGILRTALFLKMKPLADACCELIEKNIDSSNSLSWYLFAHELNLPTLKVKASECTYTHFKDISKKEEILMLGVNELKDLLFNENPHEDFEEDIFLALVAWLNFDKLNREHLAFQLLSMVRFQALTLKFIVENKTPIFQTAECHDLIWKWLQWHYSAETHLNEQKNCSFKSKKMSNKLAVVQSSDDGIINIETFNPKSNSWFTEIKTNRLIKAECTLTIVIDDKLIVAGEKEDIISKSVECFNLHTSEWIGLPPLNKPRQILKMENLKGNLCVIGAGINENSNSMEIYNFFTREWHDIPMPKTSVCSRITTHNEMLFILDFDYGCLKSYNLSSNEWTSKEIKKDSLYFFGFAAVEGFLYIFGGYNSVTKKWVDTVKRYNISNDSWCEMASLPNARTNVKITVFENKFIICDSYNVDEYSIETDTWNTLSPLKIDHNQSKTFNICNLNK